LIKWWRIAISVCKLNKCKQSTPPLKHGGRIIVHPLEKCEIFNQYFSKISHIEEEPDLPTENINPVNTCPDISCLPVPKPVFWSICGFSFIMNTISFTNSFSYGAVHKRLIIRSNNYYFGGDMFVTHSVFCSDHCPVNADVNVKVNKQLCFKRIIKKYDQADYASMNDELNMIDWNTIFHNKTIYQEG
jgi:hypothetical protein